VQARVKKLGHVAIAVRDLDRSLDFYTRLVGMRLTERFEYPPGDVGHGVGVTAGAFVRCDATHHALAIFQPKEAPPAPGAPDGAHVAVGLHHLAFELSTPEELLAKLRELRSAGVAIVNCRVGGPGSQPRFYACDPDGHLVEFYWGIDEIGWDGVPRAYEPIREIDLEAFDFDGFVAAREEAAARLQAVAADAER
jgi:catechol 2,3-dioxygenase